VIDLLPYQLAGAEHLSTRTRAYLADEMGLGKTAQVIRAADMVDAKVILIVCPACACRNWQAEFIKFGDERRSIILDGVNFKQSSAYRVLIVSYDMLSRNKPLREYLALLKRCVTVCDEAHYLKSKKAKRTKAVFGNRLEGAARSIVGASRHVWLLSGTPIPNNASEMYAPMFGMGMIPPMTRYDAFLRQYTVGFDGPFGYKITGSQNQKQLMALWRGNFLRRRKAEVLPDLPPITWATVVVEGKLPRGCDVPHIAGMSQAEIVDYMQQNTTGLANYRRIVGESKIKGAVDYASNELYSGCDKLVIFAHHTSVIDGLAEGLADHNPVIFDGRTSSAVRADHESRFRNDPTCRVFIGQLTAAGTAINLDASSRVLFVEQDWVPGNNAQAAMRVHRMTQKSPCLISFATLPDSIDEMIADAVLQKTKDIIKILGD